MKSFTKLMVVSLVVLGSSVFASGFRCTSDDGYSLKIFNHVNAENGTRLPAVLVLSDEHGTLISAKGNEISKRNLSQSVQYTVDGRNMGIDFVIAQIQFKEGREYLDEGELVNGHLIFARNGERDVKEMICSRYKKN